MKRCQGKSNLETIRNYLDGTRPFEQIGYSPDLIIRKEGETWKDASGTSWIYEDGRKKAINRISKIIEDNRTECGICKMNIKLLGNRLDVKMYRKTGNCFDCQIKFESELKRKGLYEKYEKKKIYSNQKSFCIDMKQKLEESIKYLEDSNNVVKFMNEDGSEDKWTNESRLYMLEMARKDYQECLKSLSDIEGRLKEIGEVNV